MHERVLDNDDDSCPSSKNVKGSFHNVTELLGNKFWEEANWIEIVCEVLFHIKRRETTISLEIYTGFIQFVSCMYVLPVIPGQLLNAGYDEDATYVVTVSTSLTAYTPFISSALWFKGNDVCDRVYNWWIVC